MTPKEIADLLEAAPRLGADADEPEGLRYVQISDTLTNRMVQGLRRIGVPTDVIVDGPDRDRAVKP